MDTTRLPFSRTVSRRSVLAGGLSLAALTGLGAPVLSSCSSSSGLDEQSANGKVTLPAYVPFAGPKPQLPGNERGVNPGYTSYPAKDTLVKTVTKVPGDGKPVTALTSWWGSARPGIDQNSYWQALNEQLGSRFEVQLVPGTEYAAKFATTIAGGKLPDLFTIVPQPQLPRLLKAQAVNLTQYLSGDAVKKYPNIAGQPTDPWNGAVHSGGIYAIPVSRGILPSVILYQREDLLAERRITGEVKTFEEFLALCKEINDPKGGRWALANFPIEFVQQMMGIPNDWSLKDGKLKSSWEYEEQRTALEAGVKLVKAGVVHPDAFSGVGHKERFYNGQAYFARDSLAAWIQFHSQFETAFPAKAETFTMNGLKVPGYEAGMTASAWRGPSMSISAGVGKAAEDRIETILQIVNFLAAPFGSEEYLFLTNGLEGKHFEWADGKPMLNDRGRGEAFMPSDLVSSPYVIYSKYKEAVEKLHAYETYLEPIAQFSPTNYLYSDAFAKSGTSLKLKMIDTFNEIVQERQPVNSWTDAVGSWRTGGGDQIRTEFEKVIAGDE